MIPRALRWGGPGVCGLRVYARPDRADGNNVVPASHTITAGTGAHAVARRCPPPTLL